MGRTVAVAIAGALIGLQPASAQDSGSVTVDVGECVEIESAADRLACFEARVNAVLDESDAAAAASEVAEREVVESRRRSADELPTAAEQAATRAERRAARRAEREAERARDFEADTEYVGTVASFEERLPDSLVITLENGQIWEQTSPRRYALRPGYEVIISESTWGEAYRLHAPSAGGFILVRRVR